MTKREFELQQAAARNRLQAEFETECEQSLKWAASVASGLLAQGQHEKLELFVAGLANIIKTAERLIEWEEQRVAATVSPPDGAWPVPGAMPIFNDRDRRL